MHCFFCTKCLFYFLLFNFGHLYVLIRFDDLAIFIHFSHSWKKANLAIVSLDYGKLKPNVSVGW